jgi:hypothetical protein
MNCESTSRAVMGVATTTAAARKRTRTTSNCPVTSGAEATLPRQATRNKETNIPANKSVPETNLKNSGYQEKSSLNSAGWSLQNVRDTLITPWRPDPRLNSPEER